MNKITSSQLKKYLENLENANLLKEILELFHKFSEVKEFYQIKLSSSGNMELCEKYKMKIKNEFFPTRGFGKARLSVARKAVADFKKISTDIRSVADVMIYYAEMGVNFTNVYGDIDEPFYNSMESMYEESAKFVVENKIATSYIDRFRKMVDDTSGMGWGFHDTLESVFGEYFSNISS